VISLNCTTYVFVATYSNNYNLILRNQAKLAGEYTTEFIYWKCKLKLKLFDHPSEVVLLKVMN